MLTAVGELVPELFPFVHSAYSSPSSLFFGDSVLDSSEGVQQGDPLGPLLFCLIIHDILKNLRCEFGVFYLDDGTLGGSLDEVLGDVQMVKSAAGDMGLQLNHEKLEIICDDPSTRDSMLSAFPGLCVVNHDHASILGSPFGSVEGIEDTISAKTTPLAVMGTDFASSIHTTPFVFSGMPLLCPNCSTSCELHLVSYPHSYRSLTTYRDLC